MFGKAIPGWAMMVGAAALSVSMVTAFTDASTGARTVTASVVTDANAYLAIAVNALSPHDGFASVSSGKITLSFGNANLDASGDGINVDGAYEFDSIVKVTNAGTASKSVDLTFGGADSTLCNAVLTTAEDQSASTYTSNPSPITLAVDAVGYLGVKVSATGKAVSDTVTCTIAMTAS